MALSQYDQSVRDAGYKYVPQSQYLLDPFQIPQGSENEVPTGIATTYQAQSGGGGGMGYTGGITGLTTDFQNTVDARTQRLEDAYNNPSTAKLFGMNMFKQDVNPADAGFYVAEDMRIPQQRTMLGKMFQPQSPQEIMEEGYTPRTNIGILNAILGKADKFGTLPRADQAFITSQMGYTGPTVFGENTTGGSKDPFGLNTRSAFGNYAERVGTEVDSLTESLSGRLADKYGVEFDEETGMFVGANAAKANQMTKMMRAKLNFYRQKVKERDELRRQDEARRKQEFIDSGKQQEVRDLQNRIDRGDFDSTSSRPDRDRGSVTTASAAASKGVGGGGYTKSDSVRDSYRGRYMLGGLTDLVDIYD